MTNTTGTKDRTEVAMGAREQPATPEPPARTGATEHPVRTATTEHPVRTGATEPAGAAIAPLFDAAATDELRGRWNAVQGGFVDEPRSAVEQADGLVGDVMKRLADSFASERQSLESQWSRGDDVSTEELRLALRRYRSFFDRLLSL